ncbi:MAG TPA: hypothetical protein PK095_03195 [Myxococcota bacterium]|nr:hypothetical protein [Myxococcota bacterium]
MPPRRSYDHLTPVTNAGIRLTAHAAERSCDRDIPADALMLALDHGREVHIRGAAVFAIGRNEVDRAARHGVALRRLLGLHVVVAEDGSILTAYWNHKFDNLRPHYRASRAA